MKLFLPLRHIFFTFPTDSRQPRCPFGCEILRLVGRTLSDFEVERHFQEERRLAAPKSKGNPPEGGAEGTASEGADDE